MVKDKILVQLTSIEYYKYINPGLRIPGRLQSHNIMERLIKGELGVDYGEVRYDFTREES